MGTTVWDGKGAEEFECFFVVVEIKNADSTKLVREQLHFIGIWARIIDRGTNAFVQRKRNGCKVSFSAQKRGQTNFLNKLKPAMASKKRWANPYNNKCNNNYCNNDITTDIEKMRKKAPGYILYLQENHPQSVK